MAQDKYCVNCGNNLGPGQKPDTCPRCNADPKNKYSTTDKATPVEVPNPLIPDPNLGVGA